MTMERADLLESIGFTWGSHRKRKDQAVVASSDTSKPPVKKKPRHKVDRNSHQNPKRKPATTGKTLKSKPTPTQHTTALKCPPPSNRAVHSAPQRSPTATATKAPNKRLAAELQPVSQHQPASIGCTIASQRDNASQYRTESPSAPFVAMQARAFSPSNHALPATTGYRGTSSFPPFSASTLSPTSYPNSGTLSESMRCNGSYQQDSSSDSMRLPAMYSPVSTVEKVQNSAHTARRHPSPLPPWRQILPPQVQEETTPPQQPPSPQQQDSSSTMAGLFDLW